MRLNTIKLAGFKSFVDPTTIVLQSNLTAVVGPNGCGKSNVVDALRWVIGESSAKQLRGELLTDVIFNGTAHRKPVGQASIELSFDNSDGSIGGAYAQYSEISIRREITREGQSQFYLNGTRCRRRDITDIFLGTGLGPASYAIIEQGIISQLIDSKPEELRVYLEEASGISKYRERRRETENRIRNTRENLARLGDLRQEISKQLEHLKRQANAAERFKVLKQEQRQFRAQLHALHCQALDKDLEEYHRQLNQQITQQEAKIAEHRRIERDVEQNRVEQTGSHEAFNHIQGHYYQLGADIARQEQQIHHIQERQKQLSTDLEQIERIWEEAEQHLEDDRGQLTLLDQELTQLEPQAQALLAAAADSQAKAQAAEQQQSQEQAAWEQFQTEAARIDRQAQVEETKLQHLLQKIQSIEQQLQRLEMQHQTLDFAELPNELNFLKQEAASRHEQAEGLKSLIAEINQQILTQREHNRQEQLRNEDARQQLHQLLSRQTALEALQKAALGKTDAKVQNWLQQQQWDNRPRLLEGLQVTPGWETAVEVVLSVYLEAVCTDNQQDFLTLANEFTQGKLTLFYTQSATPATADQGKAPKLSGKVQSQWPLHLLDNIYAVEDVETAMTLLAELHLEESVVTRDGAWFGASWLRVSKHLEDEGVLQRKQQLEELNLGLSSQQTCIQQHQENLRKGQEHLSALDQQKDTKQRELNDLLAMHSDTLAQFNAKQQRLEQSRRHEAAILQQLSEQKTLFVETLEQRELTQHTVQQLIIEQENYQERKDLLLAERDSRQQSYRAMRQQAQADKQQVDEYQVRISAMQSQVHFLKQNIQRSEKQLLDIKNRKETLLSQNERTGAPLPELQGALQNLLNQRLNTEKELDTAREKVNQIEQILNDLEKQRVQVERDTQSIRDTLEQIRIEQSSLQANRKNHLEQIEQSGYTLTVLVQEMPEQAEIAQWQQQLEQLDHRLQRLGAINLAAIDEYNTLTERKTYLDNQDQDLNDALTTLEEAIRKIDRETRARLRDTFDRANQNFKELFSKVFGGGQAELEFTSEEVLTAGVMIRAQPPGKRNTLLHLLSGGEKALTAIALVFALFQLNPAPFCVLDEVDAPLDEANVRRFSNLVADMSEQVQFLFISHNKVTMEMARQLIGVTMQEPGVSRIVAVDIEQAVAMAEA